MNAISKENRPERLDADTLERLPDGELLTPEQVASFLKLQPDSLRTWRRRGIGPSFVRLSGHVIRYRAGDLRAFVRQGSAA